MAEFGHIVRISVGAGCCTTSMDSFSRIFHLRDRKYWDYKHPKDYTWPWSVILLKVFDEKKRDYFLKWYAW